MKMHIKTCIRFSSFIMLAITLSFTNCRDNDIEADNREIYPPDPSKETGLEYYYPDSGGVATQLVLKGYNLGTDTSYLKVTVNGKNARVIGVKDDYVYAIVPARADTGLVKLYVGKNEDAKEFIGDTEFKYQFRRNVSSFAGVYNTYGYLAGPYSQATFNRPWNVTTDSEGAVYVISEGRGTDKNGALHRLYQGYCEVLVQNNTGPFQSPNYMCFSKNEDTLFIANRKWASDGNVRTTANVIYATRDDNFMQWKNLLLFDNAETHSVAVNPVTGEIFFDSYTDGYIYRYDKTKPDSREALTQINGNSNIRMRLAFNKQGTVLAMSLQDQHCIFKADYDIATRTLGTPVLLAGQWNNAGYQEGVGAAAQMRNPYQGVYDSEGNFFFGDRNNHVIRRVTPDGETSLWAGIPGPNEWGNTDGLPLESRFRDPEGLGILNDGELYVAQRNGHNIRRIVVE